MVGKIKDDRKENENREHVIAALTTLGGSGTILQTKDAMASAGVRMGDSTLSDLMKRMWMDGSLTRENAKTRQRSNGHNKKGRLLTYTLAQMPVTAPAPAPAEAEAQEDTLMTAEMKERQERIRERAEALKDMPVKKETEEAMRQAVEEMTRPENEPEPAPEPVRTQARPQVQRMGWAQALENAYLGKKVVSDATGNIYAMDIKGEFGLVSVKDGKPVKGFPEEEIKGVWHIFVEPEMCPYCGSEVRMSRVKMSGNVVRFRCTCTNEDCCAEGPLGTTVEDATVRFNTRVGI